MNTQQVDYLNIGLMLFSCVLAFFIPFELFLFSYAVLGPLHYLTEISWLHKRNYFVMKNKDWSLLFICGVLILFTSFFDDLAVWLAGGAENLEAGTRNFIVQASQYGTTITFLAFGWALIMILVKSSKARFGAYALLLILGLAITEMFPGNTVYYLLFAVFIPTLIHVFVFTGLFMLYGALKSKSKVGLISVGILVLCAISFFVITPNFDWYQVGEYTRESYNESFLGLNLEIFRILVPDMVTNNGQFLSGFDPIVQNVIYGQGFGTIITRFIAFAYTYHYLNWFSKTSIIRWHDVPKSWLAAVLVIWALSIALYAYNYKVGLFALYFLSFLHVYLEFPLNWVSFKGIGEELGKIFGKGAPAAS